MSDSFVHLHTHTEFSMLDGASRVDDLFAEAARMGMPALAVTDHGVMYGAIDFYRAGERHGVKPIVGCELYVATRSRHEKSSREKDSNHHLTVVAATDEGYRNLMRLVSAAHLDGFYYRPRVDKELLAANARGLIATTGCLAGEVGQLLLQGQVGAATAAAGTYREIFGPENLFVEVQDHGLADQKTVMPHLMDIARRTGAPLLATNDLHYVRHADAPAHDVLLCIQTGSTINEPGRLKFDSDEFYLKSPRQMRTLFADLPEACDATLAVAERCALSIEFGTLRVPAFAPPAGEAVEPYLRRLTTDGARRRYGDPIPAEVGERIDHELSVILQMGFAEYFLIVADLIAFARARGIRVGPGRGSAAGSVVSYCLGIVDIDPIRWGLIFERFLNLGRTGMPDIDMDFDERRRGEVIAYVSQKYGEDRVAQIVTFATIKGKQAIRDAARVLGYPYVTGDRLAKMYPPPILGRDAPLSACFDAAYEWPDAGSGRNEAYPNATDLRGAYETDDDSRRVLDIARGLEGLRRQVSVHAAGVVISDRPLVEYMPVRRADDDRGGIVTQYEMHAVEQLGLLKMDFLGLRNLTVIEDTLANLLRRGVTLDIDTVPLDDPDIYAMLGRGETIGVFQLESAGMRELVKRLQPDRFEDLMALVALYRPGPLGEGMHHEYASRKHGLSTVAYLHPDLEPILRDTYGVILYQEQVLWIASEMAGFTMTEADALRQAMGKKIAAKMRAQREKFIAGCTGKRYTPDLAGKLWEMIDHFSGYGFGKSHSCGYALVAYQTAYLKAKHPVEYMAALLTSVKPNQDRSALYLAECRNLGITVEPPDVNASHSDFTPTAARTIRYGLSAVRNVGESVVGQIIRARDRKGPFTSFVDLTRTVDPIVLNRRVIESLAKAGAFDSLGVPRSFLLQPDAEKGLAIADAAARLADAAVGRARAEEAGQFSLFGDGDAGDLPAELPPGPEIPKEMLLAAEKEMLGAYVSDHPLLGAEAVLRASTDTRIADIEGMSDQHALVIGGLVTRLQKRFTRKGEPMSIFWLEDLEGAIEVVVFPSAYASAQGVLEPDAVVCVKGKVDRRDDQPKVVAGEVWRPEPSGTPNPIVLSVAADRCTPDLVERLKGVLENHPGPMLVHLRLTSTGSDKTLRLPSRFGVEPSDGLYAELKALLGTGALAR